MKDGKHLLVLNLFGIVLIIAISVVFIISLCISNDFWVDEAMLAQTVFTRTFIGIASAPPDYSQNAPLGYLFIVKLFSFLLGNTSFAVRLPSALAGFAIMFLSYRIGRHLLKSAAPFLYAGISGLCNVILNYASQIKQYTCEAMCCLLCIWLIGLYWQGKIKPLLLSILFAITLWFSFTSVLFMFGSIIVIISTSLIRTVKKEKSTSDFIKESIPFSITLVSVLVYLGIWIVPCISNLRAHEPAYWDKIGFPLIPHTFSDIKLLFAIIKQMSKPLTYVGVGMVAFALAYLLLLIDRKANKILLTKEMLGIYLALTVGLIASYLKYLPMTGRIWIFLYPLIMISVVYVFENFLPLFQSKRVRTFFVTMVCLVCVVDFAFLVSQKKFLWNGEQLSRSVEYMNAHKDDNDIIYVEASAIPLYSYLTNYDTIFDYFPDKNIVKDNTIFAESYEKTTGENPYEYVSDVFPEKFEEVLQAVTAHNSVWLLFAHCIPIKESKNAQWQLLEGLKKYGTVTLLNEYAGTPLYKFERF